MLKIVCLQRNLHEIRFLLTEREKNSDDRKKPAVREAKWRRCRHSWIHISHWRIYFHIYIHFLQFFTSAKQFTKHLLCFIRSLSNTQTLTQSVTTITYIISLLLLCLQKKNILQYANVSTSTKHTTHITRLVNLIFHIIYCRRADIPCTL